MVRSGLGGRLTRVLAISLCAAYPGAASAVGSVSASLLGPTQLERGTGEPSTVRREFQVPSGDGEFFLSVVNGTLQGKPRVSAAVIRVNGQEVLGPADFSQQAAELRRRLPPLPKGTNLLEAEVRSAPGSTLSVSITGEYVLDVTIEAPGAGTEVAPRTQVRGTWAAYTADVGIAVNGIPAALLGDTFVAAEVPTGPGAMTLKAVLTTAEGLRDETQVEVLGRTEPRPLELWANAGSGAAPLEVTFRGRARGFTPVQYRYDFDDDGTFDAVGGEDDYVGFTYTRPGIYSAVLEAQVEGGPPQTARRTVVVEDLAALDPLLQSRWTALAADLSHQNVERALESFLPESRPQYEALFRDLGPKLAETYRTPAALEFLDMRGSQARYYLVRREEWEGVIRDVAYLVVFAKGSDGLWKIREY